MSIQQQLFALLSGATAAGIRVYPLTAPAAVVKPYIVYQRISYNSENVLDGSSGLANTKMQIDVYDLTYGGVVALSAQVDALMSSWAVQNVSNNATDLYESDVMLHRMTCDYSIWHPTDSSVVVPTYYITDGSANYLGDGAGNRLTWN
jgi:hypothetical protein